LALSAVIFDYGIVLTGPPNAEAWAAMQRITGLPEGRFTTLFWANRHALDEGKLTGIAFWQSCSAKPACRRTRKWLQS
jgi:putative hydrolase of the HAD superfamily